MVANSVAMFRREKKGFTLDGALFTGKPPVTQVQAELQAKLDSAQWPQECANCGGPVHKTDSLAVSTNIKRVGTVSGKINGIPYCDTCYPKIKKAQKLNTAQLVLAFVIAIPLAIGLIVWQINDSNIPVVFCYGSFLLAFVIGYGISWLIIKLPARLLAKDTLAKPMSASLTSVQASKNKFVRLTLNIPNENYAAKFAQLNSTH